MQTVYLDWKIDYDIRSKPMGKPVKILEEDGSPNFCFYSETTTEFQDIFGGHQLYADFWVSSLPPLS